LARFLKITERGPERKELREQRRLRGRASAARGRGVLLPFGSENIDGFAAADVSGQVDRTVRIIQLKER